MRTRSIQRFYINPLKHRVPLHVNTRAIPAYFFILLTLPGWFFAFLTGNTIVADIAAIIGTIICIGWIWNNVVGKPLEMVRFVRLGAAWLCLIQNFSWLTASFLHRFSLHIPIEESLANVMAGGVSISYYALAIFYTISFCAALSYLGSLQQVFNFEKKIHNLLMSLKNIKIKRLALLLWIPIAIEVLLLVTGVVGQRTIVVEGYDEGDRPGWLMFYESFLPAQIIFNALLTAFLANKKVEKNVSMVWVVLISSVFILSFLFFNKGRSIMVFSLLAYGYWFVFYNGVKPKLYKVIIVFCIVYPILSQILLFNNFIRGSSSGLEEWKGSAIEVVPQAWERFQESDELQSSEGERTTRNLSTRPLVALPLAMCLQLPPEQKTFMWGRNILHSFVWALPGPIFSNKADYPILEGLLYQHFPIGEADTADSLYLSSYNEFGWLGIIIYPGLLTLFWIIVLSIIQFFKISEIATMIGLAIFFQLFTLGIGENAVINWLIALRTLTLWMVLDKILRLIFMGKKNKIKYRKIHQPKRYKTLQTS